MYVLYNDATVVDARRERAARDANCRERPRAQLARLSDVTSPALLEGVSSSASGAVSSSSTWSPRRGGGLGRDDGRARGALDEDAGSMRERLSTESSRGDRAGSSGAETTEATSRRKTPPRGDGRVERAAVDERTCNGEAHLELAGDVVGRWGTANLLDSSDECCAACRTTEGCNVWVYCADAAACGDRHRQCWLKKQPLYRGLAAGAMGLGPDNPWTSGWLPIYTDLEAAGAEGEDVNANDGTTSGGMREIDITATGSNPPARARECGDPAVDGYAHVVPACLEKSRTAREFDASPAARAKQVVWYEAGSGRRFAWA